MGEIALILFVALLVYGGKLPEVAAAVGRSLAELKRGLKETTDAVGVDVRDLDPRRSVRRAWDDARAPIEQALTALPAPGASAPTEVATEDISVPSEAGPVRTEHEQTEHGSGETEDRLADEPRPTPE